MKTRKIETANSAAIKRIPPAKSTPGTKASAMATSTAKATSSVPHTPIPAIRPTASTKHESNAAKKPGTSSVGKKAAVVTKGPVKKVVKKIVKGRPPLGLAKTAGKKPVVVDVVKEEANVASVAAVSLKSEQELPIEETKGSRQQQQQVPVVRETENKEECQNGTELNEPVSVPASVGKGNMVETLANDEKKPIGDVHIRVNGDDESQVGVQNRGNGGLKGKEVMEDAEEVGEEDMEDVEEVDGVDMEDQEEVEDIEEVDGVDMEDQEEVDEEDTEDVEKVDDERAALQQEMQVEISDMAKQRQKKKELEIFVGGLDRDAVEEDIKKAFETVGEVVEVRLNKDLVTNKNKGFAFVKFSDKEQASKALTELQNPIIRGKRCGIAPSEDNDTLFLGNICNTWTKEAVRRKLQEYGVVGVENVNLVGDPKNEGVSRGFAFIEFACHVDAMNAYKRLQKPDVVFGHPERTAKVAFAEPLREPDAQVMAQVKSVFVDGLPPQWDEERVKGKFKEYGDIERVILARNMSSAKRKDFGFVNFATHESALACIEGVNNTELGDGNSKMNVRARLVNPLPKTQAVKGGISGGFRIGQFGTRDFSRFGRGSGRGRFSYGRAGSFGGRGSHPRGRGRVGGLPFTDNKFRIPYSELNGRSSYRGGRRGAFRNFYETPIDDFSPRFSSGRRGSFHRGLGDPSYETRQLIPLEQNFGEPFDGVEFDEDPYIYGDVGHSMKRPFFMMEHDPRYLDPISRQLPRYDYAEHLSGDAHFRDTSGPAGAFYFDYPEPDISGGEYLSRYDGGYYY